ncbi:HEPN domain-containing protein [Sinomicrobium sp. M5D2P9]
MALPIRDITQKLVQLLEVQYIYQTDIEEGSLLIILLRGRCSALTTELATTVGRIFQEETAYRYRIFDMDYAEEQLKDKNLFFIHGCLPHKLVYKATEDAPGLLPYTVDEVVKNHLKVRYTNETVKARAFLEGAQYYKRDQYRPHAALMLHQYVEISLRFATLFIMGKERKSHSIKELQNNLRPYAPKLGRIFNTETEEEALLLKLLDEAYIASRYRNDYHITDHQLTHIHQQAEQIETLLKKRYNYRLKGLKSPQQATRYNGVAEYPLEEDTLLQELIAQLEQYITPYAIYVMGKRKEVHTQQVFMQPAHYAPVELTAYTLLILVEDHWTPSMYTLLEEAGEGLSQPCCVYPIVYDVGKAWDKVDRGHNFLSRTIMGTPLAYYKGENPENFHFSPARHPKMWKQIYKKWKSHWRHATYIHSTIEQDEYPEDAAARVAVLGYALEQVCLGLLFVFWEFKPRHYALDYLLHLCSHFTELPDRFFPKTSYREHYLFHLLCYGHRIIRSRTNAGISRKDVEKAYGVVDGFMSNAREIAEQELERLKKLHYVREEPVEMPELPGYTPLNIISGE